MLSPEFKQSLADPNLYLRIDGILMLLYVDDISMLYPEEATKAAIEVKARLSEKYTITNLGPASQFLGIEIHSGENSTGIGTCTAISLGQKTFISTILKRFNMQNAHGASTPMDPNVKLDLAEDRGEKELKDINGYQAIVGSLMYAALATRPDILFAVAALCRYNCCPVTSHLTAVKRGLQYHKTTADFRLHFSSTGSNDPLTGSNDQLTAYTDSDWANDSADRKSQGGHVFLLSNGAVSWQSRKQDHITMSTLEAEYIAFSVGSREAKWLIQLHRDIHGKDASLLPINCDNQGALSHITTGMIKAWTKHIDICYHNSRDLHARMIVDYSYVHTNENVADILTKALMKDKHEKFTKVMGLL